MDWMIGEGALFCWYFHFMPVGRNATPELMPTPEQREHMYHFIREMREKKPLFTLDFQNDGEFVGGCIAGGKNYLHINPTPPETWSRACSSTTQTPTSMM